ncbi:MAG: hypothetical protein AB2693_34180 [Candidatus Thiodiazotropha sp.]
MSQLIQFDDYAPVTPEREVWRLIQQETSELTDLEGIITSGFYKKLLQKTFPGHAESLRQTAVVMYEEDPDGWGLHIRRLVHLISVIRKLSSEIERKSLGGES